MSGWVYLGWSSKKQSIKDTTQFLWWCSNLNSQLLKSKVKHSTTEPLHSSSFLVFISFHIIWQFCNIKHYFKSYFLDIFKVVLGLVYATVKHDMTCWCIGKILKMWFFKILWIFSHYNFCIYFFKIRVWTYISTKCQFNIDLTNIHKVSDWNSMKFQMWL